MLRLALSICIVLPLLHPSLAFSQTVEKSQLKQGIASLKANKLDLAIKQLKVVLERDRKNADSHYWIATAYLEKLKQATFFEKGVLAGRVIDHLKTAVHLDPNLLKARISLIQFYINAPPIGGGSLKKARQHIEVIQKTNPAHAHALTAQVLLKENQPQQALAEYKKLLSLDPQDANVHYQVGMLYQELKEYPKAFATFEQVLTINSAAMGALYQIGRTALFAKSNLKRGITCLQTYLKHPVQPGNPGWDAAHWRLGMLYELMDKKEAAKAAYQQAMKLNPADPQYKIALDGLANKTTKPNLEP